jgi:general stress protein 26
MEPTEKRLQNEEAIKKFQDLVKEVSICMFTTLDDGGEMSSRPMATIKVDDEGNAWFFTNEFSEKIQEVSKDNVVHLIYSHPGKNVYVNVKGICSVIIDRKKMEEMWTPAVRGWFPDGLNDSKICLLKVHTEEALYWKDTSSKAAVFFKKLASIAKADKFKEGEKGKLHFDA